MQCVGVGTTMSPPTLCIIDVQPYFKAARRVTAAVVKQIHEHRRMGSSIILVEYDPIKLGHSSEEILIALSDYGRSIRVVKRYDDGSDEIADKAHDRKISLKNINICGVNACCCVKETALGLAKMGCNVKLIKEASWCELDWPPVGHDSEDCMSLLECELSEVKYEAELEYGDTPFRFRL
jgi:hypothetical protein